MNQSHLAARLWPRLTSYAFVSGLLLIVGLAAAQESHTASVTEAQRLIAHSTIDFSQGDHHYYEYFAVDGISRGGDGASSESSNGHWFVRPDATVCFMHDDPKQSGCVFVRNVGDLIELHRVDGVVEGPFKIERGNPHRL